MYIIKISSGKFPLSLGHSDSVTLLRRVFLTPKSPELPYQIKANEKINTGSFFTELETPKVHFDLMETLRPGYYNRRVKY